MEVIEPPITESSAWYVTEPPSYRVEAVVFRMLPWRASTNTPASAEIVTPSTSASADVRLTVPELGAPLVALMTPPVMPLSTSTTTAPAVASIVAFTISASAASPTRPVAVTLSPSRLRTPARVARVKVTSPSLVTDRSPVTMSVIVTSSAAATPMLAVVAVVTVTMPSATMVRSSMSVTLPLASWPTFARLTLPDAFVIARSNAPSTEPSPKSMSPARVLVRLTSLTRSTSRLPVKSMPPATVMSSARTSLSPVPVPVTTVN